MDFEPHSQKQEDAIFSDEKTTLLITGIQFGKTTAGALWMMRKMFESENPEDAFIITAPSYKIMQQSTLPAFLKVMDGFGEYHKADATFEKPNGSLCYLRTSTEPDSIVGITNVQAIWGDEAGKYPLYFWENMQARSSFKDCPIMLTTSPYTTNWIYREILKPYKAGKLKDVKIIQASSNENPHFPLEEFNRRRMVMDKTRFAALYLGEFQRMHGLVYDCFDPDVHQCDPFALPVGTKYYGGIDWGYTDPFVLSIRAITPGGYHYKVSEFYQTKLTIQDMIQIARMKTQTFGIERFYADPSQPGHIEEFNRAGLPCVKADNDIRRGVDLHYELIKSGKFKMFKGTNPHTLDELESYHYPEPEDLEPDQDSKEATPVDQNNHCLDSDRYITISTYRSHIKLVPRVPEDKGDPKKERDHEKRIAMLKRKKNHYPGSENFS